MMPSRRSLSGALALQLRRLRPRGRVCLFDGRPALAPGGVGNPTPLAGSCCSLDAARRSSGFAAGNAAAAFRTSSVSSVFKEPPHHGAYHRPLTRSPPPFLPTPEGAGFPVAIPVNASSLAEVSDDAPRAFP